VTQGAQRLWRLARQLRRDPGGLGGASVAPGAQGAGRRPWRADGGAKVEQRLGEVGRTGTGVRVFAQPGRGGGNGRTGAGQRVGNGSTAGTPKAMLATAAAV